MEMFCVPIVCIALLINESMCVHCMGALLSTFMEI